ncbi:MAG: SEC-C domain-containing protein [Ignavibacteriae bacterium]|nr:SEC-C domain-containing protein [Ignavibacteriota bacterium]
MGELWQPKEALLEKISSKVLFEITRDIEIEPCPHHFCYCGSGIKYKKCCMGKEEGSFPSLKFDEFDLISDIDRNFFSMKWRREIIN